MSDTHLAEAYNFFAQVCEELSLDNADLSAYIPDLLKLTKTIAHGPSRPAAPLSNFLLGVAYAQKLATLPADSKTNLSAPAETFQALWEKVDTLAKNFPSKQS